MIQITPQHTIAAVNWIASMSSKDKWNLTAEDVANLLGDISVETYQEIKQKAALNIAVELTSDTIERLSLLLGIWKTLQLIAPNTRTELAYASFNQPIDNPIFVGKSIKEHLLEANRIESLYTVRRYLEAIAINGAP